MNITTGVGNFNQDMFNILKTAGSMKNDLTNKLVEMNVIEQVSNTGKNLDISC